MALHNEVGKEGEDIASAWLVKNGYRILYRNWRFSYLEVDVIATRGKFLHFIEVKSRHHSAYGHPEDSVGRKKFRHLQRAADQFLQFYPGFEWLQYDILAITLFKGREAEILLIEDVYY